MLPPPLASKYSRQPSDPPAASKPPLPALVPPWNTAARTRRHSFSSSASPSPTSAQTFQAIHGNNVQYQQSPQSPSDANGRLQILTFPKRPPGPQRLRSQSFTTPRSPGLDSPSLDSPTLPAQSRLDRCRPPLKPTYLPPPAPPLDMGVQPIRCPSPPLPPLPVGQENARAHRPPLPPKSSARLSNGSTDTASGSRPASSASLPMASAPHARPTDIATATPDAEFQSSTTSLLGLSHPQPRSQRAPSLSYANSSSSRASSSVFTPSSSALRSSYYSNSGVDTDWNRLSISEAEDGTEELSGPISERRGRRPAALGLGIGGYDSALDSGKPFADGDDFEKGLEDLARYARSLPSPLPPTDAHADILWAGPSPSLPSQVSTLPLQATVTAPALVGRHPRLREASAQSASSSGAPSPAPGRHEFDAYLSVDESGIDEYLSDDADPDWSQHYLPFAAGVVSREESDMAAEAEAVNSPGQKVVDLRDCTIEVVALPMDTTHLMLARSRSPAQVPTFLRRVVPTLAVGLVVLDISHCSLVEVPLAVASCSLLQELDISGNALSARTLPPFITSLSHLQVLLADGCSLASIPSSLWQLVDLHTLSLRDNLLRSLPASICKLSKLETLSVDHNPFHFRFMAAVSPILGNIASSAPVSPSIRQPPTGLGDDSSLPRTAPTPSPMTESLPVSPDTPSLPRPKTSTLSARKTSSSSTASTPLDSSTSATKKWSSKLLKRMRSGSTSSPRPSGARSHSEPLPARDGLRSGGGNKRRSFLQLEKIASQSTEPVDSRAALQSVMAYLRDLDDLSNELALPPVPLDSHSMSPALRDSPVLRHSPSLGNVSPSPSPTPNIRRAQSSRRLPSRAGSYATRPPSSSRSSLLLGNDESGGSALLSPDVLASVPTMARLRDDHLKRDKVVKEIIETERTYLRGLQELCDIYVAAGSVPVSSSSGRKDSVLPGAERRAVFGNIEAIREFHEEVFLPDLLEAAGDSSRPTLLPSSDTTRIACDVARVFTQHAAYLKIYSSYVNGFDLALARIQSWSVEPSSSRPGTANGNASIDSVTCPPSTLSANKRKRIKMYLKRCKSHPRHSQISLESYLLLPVQRIPRYRMLLEALVACTPNPRASVPLSQLEVVATTPLEPHPVIKQAQEVVAEVANSMNERKREVEGRAQLLQWQERISNKFRSPLVQPHRSLLRTAQMTLLRTVKRTSALVEPILFAAESRNGQQSESIYTLQNEPADQALIALLCTDLLILVKAPASSDPQAPCELFTVIRLGDSKQTPASVIGQSTLRLLCPQQAILYIQCASKSDTIAWTQAINHQTALSS